MPARTEVGNVVQPQLSSMPAVRLGTQPEQSWLSRDAREQFAHQVPALEVREMPLASFLQLMSGLGGVPISTSAEQLLMAGISPRKRVSLESRRDNTRCGHDPGAQAAQARA